MITPTPTDNAATQYRVLGRRDGRQQRLLLDARQRSSMPANTAIDVAAADLDNVWVRGGQTAGSETMWVRAFDGTDWSAWDPFNAHDARQHRAGRDDRRPYLHSNEWSQVRTGCLTLTPTAIAATQYEFWDGGTGADSGYFWTPDNAHQPADTAITLQPPTSTMSGFAAGETAGSETMWVRAFDGTDWSAWDPFTLTTLPDTTAPTVAITAPTGTLSGIVTVSANASDNVGVAGVQFYLDGALLGAEDTTTPYHVSWNTTTATNASHTLLARARDAAGNFTDSAPLTVTVSNTTAPAPDTTRPRSR